ncbi:acyl-CoA dehydrogenase family protein, partial [Sphingomonas bacterium]|uniref:acyl-CoA dehydrogenase family protein n=1 Tax=Sphingomonas bacterium TaxID=1895847 RepID=UPI0015762B12
MPGERMGGSGQYHPTIEQRELIADFQRPLEELLPVARLHLDKSGETRDRWAGIAELGLFGIALSEEAGGAGLGAAEQALLAERLGRQLASPTLIATAIAVHCDDPAIAAGVAAGEVRVAAGYRGGGKLSLLDPGDAEFVLVLESDEAVLIRIEDVEAAQGLLWASALARADAGAPVARLDGQELRRARLILAATLCGIAG